MATMTKWELQASKDPSINCNVGRETKVKTLTNSLMCMSENCMATGTVLDELMTGRADGM